MTRAPRGGTAGAAPNARKWRLLVALTVVTTALCAAVWLRSERARVAALKSHLALQVESTDGLLWPAHMTNVAWEPSANLSFRIGGRDFNADGATLEPGPQQNHVRFRSLRALGTTFRELHLWASRPKTALELRIARQADDSKAPRLNVTRSPGEGVEWTLEIPSQPFSSWASSVGLSVDETWSQANFVSIGSMIVPDSAQAARANFRFTVDNWHVPKWPDAALLTGRSGAIALRITPGPNATHAITRVEVAAGLFSLLGSGQLSFGEPNRLAFSAQGELSCKRLLAHLPASAHRARLQAYVDEHGEASASTTNVRLELAVRAEAPSASPLQFRWRLHAGCGLLEMTED